MSKRRGVPAMTTPQTLVERVAKALERFLPRHLALAASRDVLAAMLEPTEVMVDKAMRRPPDGPRCESPECECEPAATFRAMIQAALSE